MFFIDFYFLRQRSHMAIEIPYIMKLIQRAITERAALGWFYTSAQNAAVETPHKTRGNANRIFKWGNI